MARARRSRRGTRSMPALPGRIRQSPPPRRRRPVRGARPHDWWSASAPGSAARSAAQEACRRRAPDAGRKDGGHSRAATHPRPGRHPRDRRAAGLRRAPGHRTLLAGRAGRGPVLHPERLPDRRHPARPASAHRGRRHRLRAGPGEVLAPARAAHLPGLLPHARRAARAGRGPGARGVCRRPRAVVPAAERQRLCRPLARVGGRSRTSGAWASSSTSTC